MKITLKTTATPYTVRLVVKAVMTILEELIENDLLYELQLALTEACNNIVVHAYDGKEGELELRLKVVPLEYIQFEVIDWGKVFNSPSILSSCSLVLPKEEATSGRGIFIIRKVADKFVYKRVDGKNLIIIRKYIQEEKWKVYK
ncbi:ATP-binding protein [Desulfohalobiaceae bacterium Ax17]|uniref:ATP-binding protein n=1 Tax=Desulfovulcanus ferrireducens TaxID=2831190 RepID=UPI00207BCD15|nr:ATP-binding protein [Desulfovulcanus ferrireducens]MBT8764194.1 ATP-binding protein [Desulfovulcanus ferrireducens]